MVRNGIFSARPYKPRKPKAKPVAPAETSAPKPGPKPATLRNVAREDPPAAAKPTATKAKHQLGQVAICKRGRPPVGLRRVDLDLWGPDGSKLPAIILTSEGLRIEGSTKEMQALIEALQNS